MQISVVIPALNEDTPLEHLLPELDFEREWVCEIIVVDGGSSDTTVSLAERMGCRVIRSAPGRAVQMNSGAAVARGEILWFLHADTRIFRGAARDIIASLDHSGNGGDGRSDERVWGRFDLKLSGRGVILRLTEFLMNLRTGLSGIATGDHGIFVRGDVFAAMNGFASIPIMEDIEICSRLKRISRPALIRKKITTSSRRWEENGSVRTILLMWSLRLGYFLRISPHRLARYYGYE